MQVKERNLEVKVHCCFCGEVQTIKVNEEDYDVYTMPRQVRPHVQDIFPYLKPEEREMFISQVCPKCWEKTFDIDDSEDGILVDAEDWED